MKTHLKLTQLILSALLMMAVFATAFAPASASAQSSSQEKIRLMAAALRARDAGDLQLAKQNLEALLRITPSDARVQQMLNAVNQDIERTSTYGRGVYGQAAEMDYVMEQQPNPSISGTTVQPAPASQVVVTSPAQPVIDDGQPPLATTYPLDSDVPLTPAPASQGVQPPPGPPPAATTQAADESFLKNLLKKEADAQSALSTTAQADFERAKLLIRAGEYVEADALLDKVLAETPITQKTIGVIEEVRELRGDIILDSGYEALDAGEFETAETALQNYIERMGEDDRSDAFAEAIEAGRTDYTVLSVDEVSPGFKESEMRVNDLLTQARAQLLYSDYEGAQQSLRQAEAIMPNTPAAKALQVEINDALERTSYLDRYKTRGEMLNEVSRSWQRPQVFSQAVTDVGPDVDPIREKLQQIIVPKVEFNGAPLSRVISTLSQYTVQFDPVEGGSGVNMVPLGNADAPVTITLRDFSMDQILDFVTESVGYTWDVERGAVVVREGTGSTGISTETEFFPISQSAVTRMTGIQDDIGGGGAPDPFGDSGAFGGGGGGNEKDDIGDGLINFFERAGIPFATIEGSGLVFDGAGAWITQQPRNLEKIRNILRRYDQPKQVEIEAKFLEVQQGNLEQLGFNWTISSDNFAINQSPQGFDGQNFSTGGRTLAQSFAGEADDSEINISQQSFFGDALTNTFSFSTPIVPGGVDVAQGAAPQLQALTVLGDVRAGLVIDALSRQTGSDLMSAPRLTVLSGRTAQITVAQELRYPESYSDTEATASTGDGGSAIAVTPGTPQDFVLRNVGVEMEVTPTVEENENISLRLNPIVTEFEGFIQYGGPSVAIAGGNVVSAPSGFFQPIFSVRNVRTEVTIFDGATVVIGGLTREEVKTVNDKLPVLGDIPLVGRLFRSEGETYNKRNLLIFVTANLISPGGSPSRQNLKTVRANSLFQNPIVVTPGGGVSRELIEE